MNTAFERKKVRYRGALQISILALVLVTAAACGEKNNSTDSAAPSFDSTPGGPGDSSAPGAGTPLDISMAEVSSNGCINLELLHQRISRLPGDTYVRRVTSDFSTNGRNIDGTTPRQKFLNLLAAGAFSFSESSASDYILNQDTIEQQGCDAVRFTNGDNGTVEYTIDSYSPGKITLANDVLGKVTFALASQRHLEITTDYLAVDFCPRYNKIRASRTEVVRWGSELEFVSQSEESISSSYLRDISNAIVETPQGILNAIRERSDRQSVSAPITSLKMLMAADISTSMLVCPYVSTPPSGNPPPPPAEDEEAPPEEPIPIDDGSMPTPPSEEPAADPTPTPNPVPEPTPSPGT